MVINNPKPESHVPLDNVKLNTTQWDAEAHRVFEVDSTGTNIDSSNPKAVSTFNNGHICLDNSTDETLLADGVFNGDWQDTLNYNNVIIGITTSEDSNYDELTETITMNGAGVTSAGATFEGWYEDNG